jgi:transposase
MMDRARFGEAAIRQWSNADRPLSHRADFRRGATRYDKLAAKFLAMAQLASMRLWLRAYESTA